MNAGFGTCSFRISTSDPKCRQDILEFGNILLVEDENGELPDWVGFIDSRIGRDFGRGYVNVNAIAAEQILEWRIVASLKVIQGSAGSCFRQLIDVANSSVRSATQINPGNIYMGGRSLFVKPGVNVLDGVKKLAQATGNDWNVTHRFKDDNSIALYLNMFKGQVGEKTNVLFNEKNTKVLDPTIIQSGEIWNYVLYYGEGQGQGIKYAIAKNEASIARYGLRATIQAAGSSDTNELQLFADTMLAKNLEAKKSIALAVANVNRIFGLLTVGSTYTFESNTYGFQGNSIGAKEIVRIIGMEYDDMNEKEINLIVEVIDA